MEPMTRKASGSRRRAMRLKRRGAVAFVEVDGDIAAEDDVELAERGGSPP